MSIYASLSDQYIGELDEIIITNINSPLSLVNQICTTLIKSGGKRIRPRILYLAAGLLDPISTETSLVRNLGAAIEIMHTATLMHDDVIDESMLRRGSPSVNNIYGNAPAVLGGDYLFTRAFDLAIKAGNMKVMKTLSKSMAIIVQGEIEQMHNIYDTELSEKEYFDTIYAKTSVLFEMAAEAPAIILDTPENKIKLLKEYGCAVGNAFQITDDLLDYTSDNKTLGKNTGDDLAEGKITLPLIYALNECKDSGKDIFLQAIKGKNLQAVLQNVQKTDAIEKCQARALSEVKKAIDAISIFPDSGYKQSLIELAHLSADRTS